MNENNFEEKTLKRPSDSTNSNHPHGNYKSYYGYRYLENQKDGRLDLLDNDFFFKKQVLDVGCNTGSVTIEIMERFCPEKIIGIDLDRELIKKAKINLKNKIKFIQNKMQNKNNVCQKKRLRLDLNNESNFVQNLEKENKNCYHGDEEMKTGKELIERLKKVYFVKDDYVPKKTDLPSNQEYDAILFLSVSKWIHLNHGDEGLKMVFRKLWEQLREGGVVIFEPQPWKSYKRKHKFNTSQLATLSTISIKPEDFQSLLLSPEVGFSHCQCLGNPSNASKGFQRPMWLLKK